jgi:thiol-disulfide isomerase/thioredoxin
MSAASPRSPTRRRALALAAATLATPWLADRATAAYVVRPWPAAKPVPALDLADLDGKRWGLDALAGRVVVLNFWATWCEPCRIEMPSLDALARHHRERGLTVLAVNYRETAQVIRSFLERTPYSPTILLDADGDATTEWTPRVFPSTVLIGRNGLPTTTVLGDLDWGGAVAKELIDPLLAAAGHKA